MKKFVPSAANAEIIGQALLSLETSILNSEFAEIMAKHLSDPIDPKAWYPQADVLNFHKELKKADNAMEKAVSLGMKVIDSLPFPDDFTLEDALQQLTDSHQQIHRNISPEDELVWRKVNEHHYQIVNYSPYPDAPFYGYFYSLMRRFKPEGTEGSLKYHDFRAVDTETPMVFDLTLTPKTK